MDLLRGLIGTLVVFCAFGLAAAQPSPGVGPQLQEQFLVGELKNVTWPMPCQYAGNLPVQRGTNLSLFFWGVENSPGSLTAPLSEDGPPWIMWFQGGPGASGSLAFFHENGPIRLNADFTASENPYSWDKQADIFWIDQPVGTGFSTLDNGSTGWVVDEDQMASDFFGFLENLVSVFPNLATRPLILIGESYAGTYIPYITKHYFQLQNPPVKLATLAMGNPSVANFIAFSILPTLSVLETFPFIIGYDTEVYEYFKEQSHLCGYDLELSYPQTGKFPTPNPPMGGYWNTIVGANLKSRFKHSSFRARLQGKLARAAPNLDKRKRGLAHREWKRDLSGRPKGVLDPWYACDLQDYLIAYAVNFTYPWTNGTLDGFDYYDVPSALEPPAFADSAFFLNDPDVKSAIHAPAGVTWVASVNYLFGGVSNTDPSPEPMVFLDELAANATAKNISMVFYSGNTDMLIPHFGTELTIQNTTFGGIQGFTRQPSTPWYDDNGEFAGIIHQERGWKYAVFHGASHMVPTLKPLAAWTFLREFVLGNNKTGLVTDASTPAIGGEVPEYTASTLAEGPEIYVGSYTTTSTYFYPKETISSWGRYVQNGSTSQKSGALAQSSGASREVANGVVLNAFVSVVVSVFSFVAFVRLF